MFSRNPSTPSHNYDKNTGQTFKEWVVRPNKPDEAEWHRVTKGPFAPLSPNRSRVKGARSLVDIAVRVAAENLGFLEVGDLEHLPATMIHRIWEYMKKYRLPISLQSFKILARHLETRPLPQSLCKRDYKILHTTGPLATYINPLKSSSFEFIVHLTITGHHPSIDTHQLLALTELKNLGVLEIFEPLPSPDGTDSFPRVSDATVRAWSEEPDPFPALRVMRIWGNDFTTSRSLQYLSKFPALAIYDVAGLERDWKNPPRVPGWTSKERNWPGGSKSVPNKGIFQALFNTLSLLRADAVYHPDWHMDIGIVERWAELLWAFTSPHESSRVRFVDRDKVALALPPGLDNVRDYKQLASGGSSDGTTTTIFTLWKDRIPLIEVNTSFQTWGYLVYCHIGQLWADADLAAAARDPGLRDAARKAVLVEFGSVIPPRPFVALQLGTCCRRSQRKGVVNRVCCNYGTGRKFETYRTFARADYDPASHAARGRPGAVAGVKRPGGSTRLRLPIRKKRKVFPIGEFQGLGNASAGAA